ncbi:50S ribosomal protein L5 [Candidatus Woesearchaeota archaeon]|nr:50S ribosomal protein L5 [Candidatus Woesearchaeota archaeon]
METEITKNKMRTIKIDKVTLNIGAGAISDNVDKAVALLKNITGEKIVKTKAKRRVATWKLRPGLPIGAKVTLRGKKASEVLDRLLQAINYEIYKGSFTENGFSFGVKEYIDIPEVKYDPKIGIIGLQAIVTLKRPGFRIKNRKLRKKKIAPAHKITAEDSMSFAQKKLGIKIKEKKEKWSMMY